MAIFFFYKPLSLELTYVSHKNLQTSRRYSCIEFVFQTVPHRRHCYSLHQHRDLSNCNEVIVKKSIFFTNYIGIRSQVCKRLKQWFESMWFVFFIIVPLYHCIICVSCIIVSFVSFVSLYHCIICTIVSFVSYSLSMNTSIHVTPRSHIFELNQLYRLKNLQLHWVYIYDYKYIVSVSLITITLRLRLWLQLHCVCVSYYNYIGSMSLIIITLDYNLH